MNMRVDRCIGTERLKKVWMICVKENIDKKEVDTDMTDDMTRYYKWKKRTYSTYVGITNTDPT